MYALYLYSMSIVCPQSWGKILGGVWYAGIIASDLLSLDYYDDKNEIICTDINCKYSMDGSY